MRHDSAILPAIFFASLASISYEITLTRIFSIALWYHFVFMVISMAMLGIGASGSVLAAAPGLKNRSYIPTYSVMLSAGIPASYLLANLVPFDPARLSWDRMQILYIGLYYLLFAFPFFSFGMLVSTAFATMSGRSRSIYWADLTAAGTGSVLTLLLLSAFEPDRVVFTISAISLVPLVLQGGRTIRAVASLLGTALSALLLLHPPFTQPKISPYKPLEAALAFPGAGLLKTYHSPFSRIDLLRSPAARSAPGLSLGYLEELPEQVGLSIDASDLHAVTRADRNERLGFLKHLPSSLAYELSGRGDVLILDPKGGLPALAARVYAARNVVMMESNPLVIEAINDSLADFSGNIYQKNTEPGLGRSLLATSPRSFDLIDIPVTGALPSGSFGFSEDYRFTIEAFEEYLSHLSEGGILAINLFILPPARTELRALATLALAAGKNGIEDASGHIAAIRSWDTVTILFRKAGFSTEDIKHIRSFCRKEGFDLLYVPGIREEETNVFIKTASNAYSDAFRYLIDPSRRDSFIAGYLFDIRPVNDDSPFFHYYLKAGNLREIYAVMGEKWQYFLAEGYLLPIILAQVVFLGILLILLPVFRSGPGLSGAVIVPLAYFCFLGAGYMCVEISLIQKMILPLENPAYAAATVLASVLIGSGTGSLLSGHLKFLREGRIILFLAAAVLLYSLLLTTVMGQIAPLALKVKVGLVFLLLLPVGMLMGVPYPLGLSRLGETDPSLIPWALAVNGCLSVVTPVLAVMLAISAGYKTVMSAGLMMYVLAFFASGSLGERGRGLKREEQA